MKKIKLAGFVAIAAVSLIACKNEPKEETTTTTEQTTTTTQTTPAPEATPAVPDAHTTRDAVDWNGTYEGNLPCADCPGIKTTVVLNSDMTFEKTDVYEGKKGGTFKEKGKFSWDDKGSVITLQIKDESPKYLVTEGKIIMLDADGKETTGEMADKYVLTKKK